MSPRGRPSRQSLLADLDRAKAGLAEVGGLPSPEEAREIWAGIWLEETHHSTAIEGNTMALSQVKALLEERRAIGNKDFQEYLEIQAYGDAAQWVYAQAVQIDDWTARDLINLTELRGIHERVVEPVWRHVPPPGHHPDEGPGAFRRHDVQPLASGHVPPPWPDIPMETQDWLSFANSRPKDVHLIRHLAAVHHRLEQVHPFLDGNGRTGRLALNLMLVRNGYPPAIVYKTDRPKYLRGLARAYDGDVGPLAELLARSVKHSIDRFVLPALAGPQRQVPLTALVTKKMSLLALRRAAERGRLKAVRRGAQWYSTKHLVDEYARTRRRGYSQSSPPQPS